LPKFNDKLFAKLIECQVLIDSLLSMSDDVSAVLYKNVRIPALRLYRDSNGRGPGRIQEAGEYYCNYVNPGHVAPIHISNSDGDLGWIKAKPSAPIPSTYVVFVVLISG
jgi:hypothetical protein